MGKRRALRGSRLDDDDHHYDGAVDDQDGIDQHHDDGDHLGADIDSHGDEQGRAARRWTWRGATGAAPSR
jgi:hypothetical protein